MKSLLKTKKMAELMALAFLLPTAALAQGSGSHGGGEDGVFKSIRDEVGTWLIKNVNINQLEAKLELKSMSGAALQASFENAVASVGEKVVFTDQEIKFGNNSRICKNENSIITCNTKAWNSTRGDTRYLIVFHEYLGVAGIETNTETDYSRYPISSKIRSYVHTKESFELGMEKFVTPINYRDVQMDFAAIFSTENQKNMSTGLKSRYKIPFQFLSQPTLIETSEDMLKRTYRIAVLNKSQTTGESTAYLNCYLDVTTQFYSPREEWQKQIQEQQNLQEKQRKDQQKAQMIEQLSHNQQIQVTSEQIAQIEAQLKLQEEQLKAQQDEQKRYQEAQQQTQQEQQQQAQAPIPTRASKVIDITYDCRITQGKGFFLTEKEFEQTSLFKYAKRHGMNTYLNRW